MINFIMKDQNLDFVGALRTLCKELGLDFTKYSKNNQTYLNRDIENIKNILNLTEKFFIKNFKSSLGKNAREYIYRRNVLEDVCNEFNIKPTNLWVILHRARNQLKLCLESNWFNAK